MNVFCLFKVASLVNLTVKFTINYRRMNLKNSPPYILDILPDTLQHLKLIHSNNDESILNSNQYLTIFISNFLKKLKNCNDIFKVNKAGFIVLKFKVPSSLLCSQFSFQSPVALTQSIFFLFHLFPPCY